MENKISNLIIAILVIAIILIYIGMNLIPTLSKASDKSSCKNWANMQSRASIAGVQLPSLLESPCVTSLGEIDTDKEAIVYNQLANSMYDCWDMYGEGKLDFFSDFDWGSSDTHCLVCEEIEIKKGLDFTVDLDEFEEYLSNNNPPNHAQTYSEFFLGAENAKIDFGDKGILEVQGGIPIYTMFVVNKRSAGAEQGIEGMFLTIGNSFVKTVTTIVVGELSIPFLAKGTLKASGALAKHAVGGVKGNWIAAAVVLIAGTTTYALADGSQLFPSLFLVAGEDLVDQCKDTFYKPKGDSNLDVNKFEKTG